MSRPHGSGQTGDREIYQHLYEMNAGYEQVIASLSALHRNAAFDPKHLAMLSDMAREARASSNAYLTGALQTVELAAAGRYFQGRVRRERGMEVHFTPEQEAQLSKIARYAGTDPE